MGPDDGVVLLVILRVKTHRHLINQSRQIGDDGTAVNQIAMAVGVEAGPDTAFFERARDLHQKRDPEGRLPVTAENHFAIPFGARKRRQHILGRRVPLHFKTVPFQVELRIRLAQFAKGAAGATGVRHIHIEGISNRVDKLFLAWTAHGEKGERIFCRRPFHLLQRNPFKLRNQTGGFTDIGRFVPLSPERLRSQIGGVCFNQHPVKRARFHRLPKGIGLRVSDIAGEGDIEPEAKDRPEFRDSS